MSDRPDWATDGRDWPHREASRFVQAGGMDWHVQAMGQGPTILLLHGAGAATHSWRALMPVLAERAHVVAMDLPGHGFSGDPGAGGLTLPGMSRRIGGLVEAMGWRPALVVGHSAGAAVVLRMALDGRVGEAGVVAINGALKPFAGAVAPLFQGLAMGLFLNPFAIRAFAHAARSPARVARMIEGTGSRIDARGLELYGRLFRKPGHVAGTLGMMANWDLMPLRRDLGRLAVPLTLIVGEGDRAVPPLVSEAVAGAVSGARIVRISGLGHLAHEEDAERVGAAILDALPVGAAT
jgi:magnesium chelatase accessory protein